MHRLCFTALATVMLLTGFRPAPFATTTIEDIGCVKGKFYPTHRTLMVVHQESLHLVAQ